MRIAFVPAVFLIGILVISLIFVPAIFGAMDRETNMTGDPYEEDYDAGTAGVQIGMTVIVVAVGLLVLGIIVLVFLKHWGRILR